MAKWRCGTGGWLGPLPPRAHRHTPSSSPAQADWRRERSTEGSPSPALREQAVQTPPGHEGTPSSAQLDHASGYVQGIRVQLLVGSCALSSGFPRRHGVSTFPMVCFVHRDRLVEVNNRFASGGTDKASFLRHLPSVVRRAKRGVYEGRVIPPAARGARKGLSDAAAQEGVGPAPPPPKAGDAAGERPQ